MKLPSLLDAPLSDEICQEIDFKAQHAMLRRKEQPLRERADCIRALDAAAQVQGIHACVRSIEQIRMVYRGLTTNLLLMIQELYCDRLGRSVDAVVQIMRAWAYMAGVEPLDDEAVWSICAYFAEARMEQTSITAQRLDTTWALVTLELPLQIEDASGIAHNADPVLVIDLSSNQVLSFRVMNPNNQEEQANLAFYDALTSCRRPSVEDRSGVAWTLPRVILIDQRYQSTWLEKSCADLAIETIYAPPADTSQRCALVGEVRRMWSMADDRLRRSMTQTKFEQIFDRFLFSVQQFEPRRAARLKSEFFSHRKGFSQDPAAMLPPLRWLLPAAEGEIANGSILHRGLHYEHDLLNLWPGRPARLRISTEAEARAWVYFEEDVICDASAAELRRRDGSFRPNR